MSLAQYPDAPSRSHFSGESTPRERAAAAVISLAILLLLGLLILRMGLLDKAPTVAAARLTAITMPSAGSSSKAETKTAKKPLPVAQPQRDPVVNPVVPPKAIIPRPNAPPASFIPLSSSDMAAADISKMGKGSAGASPGSGKGVYGPGEGPQGQVLYRAEWVREPSDAELAGYMTEKSAGAKWAEIACRTIANNRVDNCQTLGESPAGSGLARSLCQAAWQFLVRPPRIDGKAQVGTWVRIHFDFAHAEAK